MYGHATPPLSAAGMVAFVFFQKYYRRRLEAGQAILDRAKKSRFSNDPRFMDVAYRFAQCVSSDRI